MEGIVEASWNAFDETKMSVEEESELIMTQLLGAYPFSVELDHDLMNLAMPSTYWSDHQDVFSSSNNSMSIGAPPSEHRMYYEYCNPTIATEQEATIAEAAVGAPSISFGCCSNGEMVVLDQKPQMKRKFGADEYFDKPTGGCQKLKKAKISTLVKNPKPKKNKKSITRNGDEEDQSNVVEVNVQGSISCNMEDEPNASKEEASAGEGGGAALNLDGLKARASRGSAMDPQSLYARKRRERINERLRILQNLVPNGTKVDISTMLEEAVQYVKFLQLQIKLLSSDKLWMYAPLAYNGMDVGADMKISLPNQ